jgi:hypothetical protein
VSQQGWRIWSPLNNFGSAAGGIPEILHGWAREVDSWPRKATQNLEVPSCLACLPLYGSCDNAISGSDTRMKDITENGRGRRGSQSVPQKDKK